MDLERRGGFVNYEIHILVTLVLIVAAVVIPTIYKAGERARNQKTLAELRAALKRYEADHNGMNPAYLQDLTRDGRYLKEIPEIGVIGIHPRSASVRAGETEDDSGGWVYNNWPGSPRGGEVWLNCTHVDAHGSAWSAY
jgi:competence protein ComGC